MGAESLRFEFQNVYIFVIGIGGTRVGKGPKRKEVSCSVRPICSSFHGFQAFSIWLWFLCTHSQCNPTTQLLCDPTEISSISLYYLCNCWAELVFPQLAANESSNFAFIDASLSRTFIESFSMRAQIVIIWRLILIVQFWAIRISSNYIWTFVRTSYLEKKKERKEMKAHLILGCDFSGGHMPNHK